MAPEPLARGPCEFLSSLLGTLGNLGESLPARRNGLRDLAEGERPDEISSPPERGPFWLPRFCLPTSHLIP